MFGTFGILIKINQLKNGKTVDLSRADILDFVINLYNEKKKFSSETYKEIYDLYMDIKKDNKKISMNMDQYTSIVNDIISSFTEIAPIDANRED